MSALDIDRHPYCLAVLGSPKVIETRWRQFRISHRVLNIFVAEVGLQCTRIMPSVRQCVPARMAQHVRVNYEIEVRTFADPLNQSIDGTSCEWPTAFSLKHERALRIPL